LVNIVRLLVAQVQPAVLAAESKDGQASIFRQEKCVIALALRASAAKAGFGA
jgi:hypothetical protein